MMFTLSIAGRPRRQRIAAATGAFACAAALTACGGVQNSGSNDAASGEQTIDLTFSTAIAENSGIMIGWAWLEKEIEERSDGRINIEGYYAESLLTGADTLKGIQDGRADIGWVGPTYQPAEFAVWGMTLAPLQTEIPEAQMRAYWDLYKNDERFAEDFEKNNVRMLNFYSHGPNIIGLKEPMESLDDLKGKRLRAGGLLSTVMEAAGAEPVTMSSAEVYEALDRGVLDGYTNLPFELPAAIGLHEVAPYIVDSGIGVYAQSGIAINQQVWDELPEDLQEMINEVSEEFLDVWPGLTAELEDQACDVYVEDGASVTVLGPEIADELRTGLGDKLVSTWEKSAVDSGLSVDEAKDMWETYQASLREHEEQLSGYTNPYARCQERIDG